MNVELNLEELEPIVEALNQKHDVFLLRMIREKQRFGEPIRGSGGAA
jgi:hypothetical protein